MRPIEIVGDNFTGTAAHMRVACRAIIIREKKILLSCATRHDLYMLPGGGLEDGESEAACCAREVAEETGFLFRPALVALAVDEYYQDWRYHTLYYTGEITGTTATKLTQDEIEGALAPRWLPLDAALALFAEHDRYRDVYELKRGLYLREYAALSAFLRKKN